MPAATRIFLRHFAMVLVLALVAAGSSASVAAERKLIVVPDADYPGNDYQTIKKSSLKKCQKACIGDEKCQAFTYNRKVKWCFLKWSASELRAFKGATSGRIVVAARLDPKLEKKRLSELSFLNKRYVDEARRVAGRLNKRFDTAGAGLDELREAGDAAMNAKNFKDAALAYGRALTLSEGDSGLWARFAIMTLLSKPAAYQQRELAKRTGTAAAVNAYLRARKTTQRAEALWILGRALSERGDWKPAIRAYRASLALVENERVRKIYDDVVDKHGFRITSHTVDADTASPRICIVLSDRIDPKDPALPSFISVDERGLAIEPQANQICIDGVRHGRRYRIKVRAGLPARDGEKLRKDADLDIYVRDRAPWVGFSGKSYVLPRGKDAIIPIVSVNTKRIKAAIYRIGDRALAAALRRGVFLSQLDQGDAGKIARESGEKVWQGIIEVRSRLNRNVTTAIPINDALKTTRPGTYVITAKAENDRSDDWSPLATQWFVISDIGLSILKGTDGIHVSVRALASAKAMAGVRLRLIARNNEVLARTKSDADGYGRFAAGLTRGEGGLAPRLVVAQTDDGDYGFLDLGRPAFDLTDRGVEGRPAPAPVDLYLTTERGVYRPGETVHITALARDRTAAAISSLPLTLVVERPDGVEHSRVTLADGGLGGYNHRLKLDGAAMRGAWRLKIFADPKADPLSSLAVLVEDFEPERLAFDLEADDTAITPNRPMGVTVSARYLYGAPAQGLGLEGTLRVVPVSTGRKPNADYRFGLDNDQAEAVSEPLTLEATTDETGTARFDVALPKLPRTTRLYEATIIARLRDANGRTVERKLVRPVMPDGPRIGIRPLFRDNTVEEGANAGFEIIVIAPDGARVADAGLEWTLEKLTTRFQWYREDGEWKYEPVVSASRVSDGRLPVGAAQPASLSVPVSWGRYRLKVTRDNGSTASSVVFDAGWSSVTRNAETPDFLNISLDKPLYRVGDTARLRIKPRFAGTAVISVIDNKLITMKTVAVPADGTSVMLPVTRDWGPGAYVTAALYRPMDRTARRMPARALGLRWLKVDPAERKLGVEIAPEPRIRPLTALQVPVKITGLSAGEEAYVTVAAVNLGILNLTGYKPPAPDNWYFGQRRLAMEMRDLYGNLIDQMQGVRGRVRSGGDGGMFKISAPPPPSENLVAFHSGIVRVDGNGTASVSFDIPDFNGTVRVMAMAWSKSGVGHAVRDVVVRDPVVVATAAPKFLNPGDRTRLFIEINNVEGPAGDYKLTISSSTGIEIAPDDSGRTVSLGARQHTVLFVPLSARNVGSATIEMALLMPDGRQIVKDMTIKIRPNDQPVVRRRIVSLEPAGGRLIVGSGVLAGLIPGTASATVSISGAGRFDLPGLLSALDRYPYGCAEQITSRALPLVYLNDVARIAGLGADKKIRMKVNGSVSAVLANQSAAGSFGLWGPSGGDTWLDAYVTDFLVRAKEAGYQVPKVALGIALDNLANRIAYASNFTRGGEGLAYALYVLARSGRAAIGDLRYYAETKLNAFAGPLPKAQIGAALALYGDRERASRVFQAALRTLELTGGPVGWRNDYGSAMRDGAAILTLAAETGQSSINLKRLAARIADARETAGYTSTQENAWLLLAANALSRKAGQLSFAVDGDPVSGSLYRRYDGARLAAKPVEVENRGDMALDAVITTTGVPQAAAPAGGNGLKIERGFFDHTGKPVDASAIAQNDRLVVVLTVRADEGTTGRLMVVDPLPAGLEIENPNLTMSGKVSGLSWLDVKRAAVHTEARVDRFIAAVNRKKQDPVQFKLAYSVRAVSPGNFRHPAAIVEDMYRPAVRGWTSAGRVEIAGPLR